MPDPATDLYSFLRSKDFTSGDKSNESSEESEQEDARSSDGRSSQQQSGLRSVDGFGESDRSSPAKESASSGGAAPGGTSGAGDASIDDPRRLSFDDEALGEKLRHCSESTLNKAGFGIIKVGDSGTVEFFNTYESELSGVDPDVAVGKDFFTELAPCSNNRLFRGRFQKGIRQGELDEKFEYTYTYKMRPTLVDVRLYRDDAGNNWIMVHKR